MVTQLKFRFFCTVCFIFAIVFWIASVDVWAVQTVVVNTSILNIRSGPAISFEKIGQAVAGENFTVLQEKNGWFQIQLPDGSAGWMIKDYVKQVSLPQVPDNSTDTVIGQGEVTVSLLNVRSGPDINAAKLGTVSLGTRLKLVDRSGDWYRVTLDDGRTGWVAGWLVKLQEGAESLPEQETNPVVGQGEPETTDGQLIKWSWEKTGLGVKIVIQGTQPLGYSEKILADEPKILLEFGDSFEYESDSHRIDYGNVSEIKINKGENTTAFEVGLTGEVSYRIGLSPNGCLMTIDINNLGTGGKTVVIDPGHGSFSAGKGYDPGAIGSSGLYESEVVLDIGKKVEELLTKQGIKVIMTRSGETNLSLEDRARVANEACADAFVSIHVNASVSSTLNGSSTYFYAPLGSSLEGQRTVRKKLAESIQNKLLNNLGRKNLGVREENFAVLRCTTVPSVLIETAFISNPEEEALLADEQFRERAAQAIAEGLEEYFSSTF